ncbi:MAG: SUMF1/EgtB/PvdO family nonheme iron enzyme [Rhodoplanes sp.]|jgi:formylglycine-generating enzyme required for sulfatase activity
MKWRIALLFLLIVGTATNLRWAYAQQQPAAGRANSRVALLIANSNYRDSDVKLANPGRDARALAEELRRNGFEVTVKENAGKEEMQRAIDAFAATISPGAAAVFFFGGFGIQVNRQNYLIPTDARIWVERDVQQDGISVEKILGQVHAKGAKVVFLIVDAARKNPFERRFRSYSAGLSATAVPEGTVAISSASLDKVHDDVDSDPSLFMGELLKEMRAPASATAEQIFLRTRNGVARASNGERVPWISSSLTEDFYFNRPGAEAKPPAPAEPPPARKAEQPAPAPPATAGAPPPPATAGQAPSLSSNMPGETFRDCAECPEMVVIPAGEFDMGSNDSPMEKPVHRVTLERPIAIGRREITFAEWDQCVAAGACKYRPEDRGWGRGDRPVIDVSWDDAKAYLSWLSQKTGQRYRLPTEAEWEYAARAGTTSAFWWGRDGGNGLANCDNCGGPGAPGGAAKTAPAGSFRPNAFGLYDTSGNAAEWVEDCWNDAYRGAPKDGSAWTAGQCGLRVLRGGAFGNKAVAVRPAARFRYDKDVRYFANGFRAARDL